MVEKQWRFIWNKLSFEVKHYYYYEAKQIDHLDHCAVKKTRERDPEGKKKDPRIDSKIKQHYLLNSWNQRESNT